MPDEDERTVVSAELEGAPNILLEVRSPETTEADVSLGDTFKFDRLTESIEAVASRMSAALENAKPHRASVEFGIDVGIEAGALTALIAKGTGSATMKITLEWERAG